MVTADWVHVLSVSFAGILPGRTRGCGTIPETLTADDPRVVLIGPDRLPEMALNAGPFDWLLEKAG